MRRQMVTTMYNNLSKRYITGIHLLISYVPFADYFRSMFASGWLEVIEQLLSLLYQSFFRYPQGHQFTYRSLWFNPLLDQPAFHILKVTIPR